MSGGYAPIILMIFCLGRKGVSSSAVETHLGQVLHQREPCGCADGFSLKFLLQLVKIAKY